jgi:hypothetical protein
VVSWSVIGGLLPRDLLLVPFVTLDFDREAPQRRCPKPVQPVSEFCQSVGSGPVVAAGAFGAHGYEVGIGEYSEVLADGRPTDSEVLGDVAGCALVVAHEVKDLASCGFGQGSSCCIHGSPTIATISK